VTCEVVNHEGHLNVGVRDHDSIVTGFGQHDRVVCFLPDAEGLYMRIDHKWGLGMPTERQMLRVARKDQGVRGSWVLDRIVPWDSKPCSDVYFRRKG
jgi:hypothetical protein